MESASRQVVVVLGSGRSGTSLLMQVLVRLGMAVSEDLVPANISNAEGFYEDVKFKDIQQELYACLSSSLSLPLPQKWIDTNCAKGAKTKIKEALQDLLTKKPGLIGIKDPRIGTFLPLWLLVFNQLRVVPKFILTIREPSCFVSSFVRQYNKSGDRAELVWLLRTLDAIENTALDCFVAHYEDWFLEPDVLAQNLLQYTGRP